jgi:hypothetical protein
MFSACYASSARRSRGVLKEKVTSSDAIPFENLLQKLAYKCEDGGIRFLETDEAYTSKWGDRRSLHVVDVNNVNDFHNVDIFKHILRKRHRRVRI